jgi:hypothetical protein
LITTKLTPHATTTTSASSKSLGDIPVSISLFDLAV